MILLMSLTTLDMPDHVFQPACLPSLRFGNHAAKYERYLMTASGR